MFIAKFRDRSKPSALGAYTLWKGPWGRLSQYKRVLKTHRWKINSFAYITYFHYLNNSFLWITYLQDLELICLRKSVELQNTRNSTLFLIIWPQWVVKLFRLTTEFQNVTFIILNMVNYGAILKFIILQMFKAA